MSNTFFLHIGKQKLQDKATLVGNFFDENIYIEEYLFCTFIAASSSFIKVNLASSTFYCIGTPTNLKSLAKRHLMGDINNETDLFSALLLKGKWTLINEFKGTFACLEINTETSAVSVFIGNSGLMQAYCYQNTSEAFIFSELKLLKNTNLFNRVMLPIQNYQYNYFKRVERDFCFLQQVNRLIPGYKLIYTRTSDLLEKTIVAMSPVRSKASEISYTAAMLKIEELLSANIREACFTNPIAVPLSGGVDSAMVSSLLVNNNIKADTYSVGTAYGNEYKEAACTAQYLGSQHHEVYIRDEDFIEAFSSSVWHNEICDPLYAEGYVGFYAVLKNMANEITQLFTGYGADLILGDHSNTADKSQINDVSAYWCQRAAWTGELSPYLAHYFNKRIYHPFWEIDLINFCISLPFQYKFKQDAVKAIFRDLAETRSYLSADIAWRNKTPFTKGASLDKLFSAYLRKEDSNYKSKSFFLYYLFEQLFIFDIPLQIIDFDLIKYKAINHE